MGSCVGGQKVCPFAFTATAPALPLPSMAISLIVISCCDTSVACLGCWLWFLFCLHIAAFLTPCIIRNLPKYKKEMLVLTLLRLMIAAGIWNF